LSIIFADSETNALVNPTKLHCVGVKPKDASSVTLLKGPEEFRNFAKAQRNPKWVFHNGLGYDVKVLNDLVEPGIIKPEDVIDTAVVSRLVNYGKFQTHSLKELGQHLGVHKVDYSGGFEEFTKEMGEYCIQDVNVLEAIFKHYSKQIFDPAWSKAMRVEHDIAWLCNSMHHSGFPFNVEEAKVLKEEIQKERFTLEAQFKLDFPPVLKEVKRLKYRKKKDGSLFSSTQEAIDIFPSTYVSGDELVCMDYIAFNPASSKDRIDRLWDAKWKPTDKTKGHKDFLKGQRRWT
jgi:hypothetical protein